MGTSKKDQVFKAKGFYVVMNGDEPLTQIHNLWQALRFMSKLVGRQLWTSLWPLVPKYIWHQGFARAWETCRRRTA